MSQQLIFFISRAGADRRWAEIITRVVKEAGPSAIHQDKDFEAGVSFVRNIDQALESADCTIAVLSPAYVQSEHCMAELRAVLARDPNGVRGTILPVLVAPCPLPGSVGHLA